MLKRHVLYYQRVFNFVFAKHSFNLSGNVLYIYNFGNVFTVFINYYNLRKFMKAEARFKYISPPQDEILKTPLVAAPISRRLRRCHTAYRFFWGGGIF